MGFDDQAPVEPATKAGVWEHARETYGWFALACATPIASSVLAVAGLAAMADVITQAVGGTGRIRAHGGDCRGCAELQGTFRDLRVPCGARVWNRRHHRLLARRLDACAALVRARVNDDRHLVLAASGSLV